MQPGLRCEEIIYEITNVCRNGCTFCGSAKRITADDKADTAKIEKIFGSILSVNPEKIVISGGDPLTVPFETHKTLSNMFRETPSKKFFGMIVHPKSILKAESHISAYFSIYDGIAISVNTADDVDTLASILGELTTEEKEKIVITTNVNIMNIFLLDKIGALVADNSFVWQIQLTMFKRSGEQMKISEESVSYFVDKICDFMKRDIKIVLADNVTKNPCSAGIRSCGVLYDGSVVGCLSYQSWCDSVETYGNLLETWLSRIWEDSFYTERFKEHTCCKDTFNLPDIEKMVAERLVKEDSKQPPVIRRPKSSPENPKINPPHVPEDYTQNQEALRPSYDPLRPIVMVYGMATPLSGTAVGTAGILGMPTLTTNITDETSQDYSTHIDTE